MSKRKMAVIALLALLCGGALTAAWLGLSGRLSLSAGSPQAVLVTAYDAKGAVTASECGFFISPRRLVVHRHIFRGAEKVEARTRDGRKLALTEVLAEDLNLDMIMLTTDAPARAGEIVELASAKPAFGEKLTALLPPLKAGEASADKGRPTGALTVSAVPDEKWTEKTFFFVDGALPQEATGCPVVNSAGKAVGSGMFITAGGKPIGIVVSSEIIGQLVQRADHNKPTKIAAWMGTNGKEVKLPFAGRMGRLSSWAGRTDDWAACNAEITKEDPKNAEAWMNLTSAYTAMDRYAEAIDAAQRALKADPSFGDVRSEMAWSYDKLGRYDEAIDAYKAYLRTHGTDSRAFENLGLVYLKVNRYEEALASFKDAVRLESKYPGARINVAYTYRQLGQTQASVDELVKTIQIAPDSAMAHQHLGDAYLSLGRYDDAIRECQMAATIEPTYAEPYVDLGAAYMRLEKYNEALAPLLKAIELKPDYVIAHRNLAALYGQLGSFADSVREAKETIRLDPTYAKAYADLGYACKNLKQYEDSIAAYTKSLELDPKSSTVHEGMGYAYVAWGKKDLAMKEYEILKVMDPKEAPYLLKAIAKK